VFYGPLANGAYDSGDVELRITDSAGTWLGASVASGGDADGDGIDDLLIGEPAAGAYEGRAWLVRGGYGF
jgi:hypothetical protein